MSRVLYGLERFGISLEDVEAREMSLFLDVHLRTPKAAKYARFRPSERRALIEKFHRRQLNKLTKQLDQTDFEVKENQGSPVSFRGWFTSSDFLTLHGSKEVDSVCVDRIKGLRARKERAQIQSWYGVKATYAIQIENQEKGNVTLEDRVLLVKAKSPELAKKAVQKEAKTYGEPYFNEDMELVRWHLVEIIRVDYVLESFEEGFVEVYSELYGKRIKPELIWTNTYSS